MALIVQISHKGEGGVALDPRIWGALGAVPGGLGHMTRSGALLFAFDPLDDDAVSAVEAMLDTIPALSEWRAMIDVAPF